MKPPASRAIRKRGPQVKVIAQVVDSKAKTQVYRRRKNRGGILGRAAKQALAVARNVGKQGLTNYMSDTVKDYVFSQVLDNSTIIPTGFDTTAFQEGNDKGIRMAGTAAIANIFYNGTHSQPYDLLSDPGLAQQNTIAINPLNLFSALSQEFLTATGYARYRFTTLIARYTSLAPSSAKGALGQMYYPDVVQSDGEFSFTDILTSPDSASWPLWMSGLSQDFSMKLNRTWYYMDIVDEKIDFSSARQNFQGTLCGAFGVTPSDNYGLYGTIYLTYVLELVEPRLAIDQATLSEGKSFGRPADPDAPDPVEALLGVSDLTPGERKSYVRALTGSPVFRSLRARVALRRFQNRHLPLKDPLPPLKRKRTAASDEKSELEDEDITSQSHNGWIEPREGKGHSLGSLLRVPIETDPSGCQPMDTREDNVPEAPEQLVAPVSAQVATSVAPSRPPVVGWDARRRLLESSNKQRIPKKTR